MKRAICPGTFDPITNGHIDIIKRAVSIFAEVVVAVAETSPKEPFLPYSQRLSVARESLKTLERVKVEGFNGLVVDFAREKRAKVIVRGLRMISDFEYEFQMALTNRSLSDEVETIFLMPHPEYSFISSRLIKEAAFLGADLEKFLPSAALEVLKKRKNEGQGR